MTTSRDSEARQHEENAALLGGIGRGLSGAVSRTDDAAARDRFLVSLGEQGRPIRTRGFLLAAALIACVAAFVFMRASVRPLALEYGISGPVVAQGDWLDVPADRGAVALRFSEGTEIELGPGSKGKVTDVTENGARVVLRGGALQARVVHKPRAKWSVAAGPYDIEVTGTAFDVKWAEGGERMELKLHDGSVIVRGPLLRQGIRVAAGQKLVASARTGNVELSSLFEREAAAPPLPDPVPPAEAPAVEPSAPALPKAAPSWSELVSAGSFKTVLEAASARGIDQSLNHGSLRDLVALSDAARYAGDRGLARRGLLAQRSRFASSSESHAAAFVLGRMADDAGSSSEALEWYDRYLHESSRGAFAAEALGRKLVLLVRLGRKDAAHEVAESYEKQFPRGSHAAYARELLRSSSR
jgi:ferric-dicitrate binding protein FerR (iron transport regulator)